MKTSKIIVSFLIILLSSTNALWAQQETVQCDNGKFVHTSSDQWLEINNDGKHKFREASRINKKITLEKIGSNWTFVLDFNNNTVLANGTFWSKINSHTLNFKPAVAKRKNPTAPINKAAVSGFVSSIVNYISGNASSLQKLEIKNITLRPLLKEMGKSSPTINNLISSIPSFILDDIQLVNCAASADPVTKSVGLGMSAKIGQIPINLAATVANSKKDGKMAIAFGGQYLSLANIATLIGQATKSDELQAIERYINFDAGFIASANSEKVTMGKLPLFNNQKIEKGLTVKGQANINFPNIIKEFKLNKEQTKLLKQIFGETALYMQATIPSNPSQTYMEAGVKTNIGIPSPADPSVNFLTFNGMSMGLRLDPVNTKLKCGGQMTLHLRGQNPKDVTDLQFNGDLVMEPSDQSIGLEMSFTGTKKEQDKTGAKKTNAEEGWKNPFGIPGIAVHKLAVGGSMEANIPWVNGAIKGDVTLGENMMGRTAKKIRGKMALGIDPNSPQSCFLDMSLSSLSIAALLDAFPVVSIPANSEFRKGLETGLSGTKVYVAPTRIAFARDVYEQGISFNTTAKIFGWQATYNLELNPDPLNYKFKVHGEMNPIVMKIPKTKITVLEVKGYKAPNPKLLMEAKMGQFPNANINGQVSFLKIAKNKALATTNGKIQFDKNLMKLEAGVSLFGGDYKGNINLSASQYTNMQNAKFTSGINISSKGKVRNDLVAEIKKNMKNAEKYAKMLKEAAKPGKPFIAAYRDIYNEYKKVEDDLSKAAIYVLEKGLNIQEVKLNGSFDNTNTTFGALIKASVGGRTINENVSFQVSSLDQQKFLEQISNKILSAFKNEGNKMVKDLENNLATANAQVWSEINKAGNAFQKLAKGTQVAKVEKPKNGAGQLTFINEGVYSTFLEVAYFNLEKHKGFKTIKHKIPLKGRVTVKIPKGSTTITYKYGIVVVGAPILGEGVYTTADKADDTFKNWGSLISPQFAKIKNR